MKLDIADIASVLQQRKDLPPATVSAIIKDLEQIAKEEAELREAEKEGKANAEKPYLMLIATNGGSNLNDIPFFAVESIGELDHTTVLSRLHQAAAVYNEDLLRKRGKKRKKHKRQPVETLGEVFQAVPATMLKPQGLKIRWKEPLIVVQTRNDLDSALMVLPSGDPEPDAPVLRAIAGPAKDGEDTVWTAGEEEPVTEEEGPARD